MLPTRSSLLDLDLRVVAPFRRVADLRAERRQLGVRLLPGLGAHPLEAVDALAERGAQVLDQDVHAGLGRGREVLLDVGLAEQLANRGVEVGERALPARLQLGDALQRAAAEVEARVDQRGVEVRREAIDERGTSGTASTVPSAWRRRRRQAPSRSSAGRSPRPARRRCRAPPSRRPSRALGIAPAGRRCVTLL